MKFLTGEEAILYFVETKSKVDIVNQMTLTIVEDDGARLQFDNNTFRRDPAWADIVATIVDVENILKKEMDDKDIRVLFRFAIYGKTEPIPKGKPMFDAKFERLSKSGKYSAIQRAVQRFEAALFKYNYLRRV